MWFEGGKIWNPYHSSHLRYKTFNYRTHRAWALRYIWEMIPPEVEIVGDCFGGSGCMSLMMKDMGKCVYMNDNLELCRVVGNAVLGNSEGNRRGIIERMNRVPEKDGWFVDIYRGHLFGEKAARKVQGIRDWIEGEFSGWEKDYALMGLISGMEKVGACSGGEWQIWDRRRVVKGVWDKELVCRYPIWTGNGMGWVCRGDALGFVDGVEYDLLIVDPPYDRFRSAAFYNVLETVIWWDCVEVEGKGRCRVDARWETDWDKRFWRKGSHGGALRELIGASKAKWVLLYYGETGYLGFDELERMMSELGWEEVRKLVLPRQKRIGGEDSRSGVKRIREKMEKRKYVEVYDHVYLYRNLNR